ncbi:MAG TPA: hypothetical protein VJ951_04650 [Bacteroidales bacterium]|nr:hypothetical protein [Bacteroidales bacterium]
MQRNEFIKTAGRATILSVIAAFVGIMALKGKLTRETGCAANANCNGCGSLKSCSLPNALKERSNG